MALAVLGFLFNVQYECAGWLKHSKKLRGSLDEPIVILLGRDTTVRASPLVGVGRRGDDKVKGVVWVVRQNVPAVALNNLRFYLLHIP